MRNLRLFIPGRRTCVKTGLTFALILIIFTILTNPYFETTNSQTDQQETPIENTIKNESQMTTATHHRQKERKRPAKERVKGIVVLNNNNWKQTIDGYLEQHQLRCEKDWENMTVPKSRNNFERKLCDCVPETLLRSIVVTFEDISLNKTKQNNPEVTNGGHWEPTHCIPRYRVSIIVPFRDRTQHLHVLLRYLHPVLQGQQVSYDIIVVEQRSPRLFNKASLMNIGYVYTMQEHHPDCVVFHDVDRIPQDGRHFYYCPELPYHLGAYHDEHKYRIHYNYIFGAVTAFRPSAFERVNGFSNRFWGWGGEDDDMSKRVSETFNITEPVRPLIYQVAGFKTIRHKRDPHNIGNRTLNRYILKKDRRRTTDGLNSMSFNQQQIVKYPLYTRLYVDLECTGYCKIAKI